MSCKISVIIPVFGVEKYIERCVRSLFSQSFKSVEYIFIDDASNDRSIDIVKSIASEFPNRTVKILYHDENLGLPAARNTGLKAASGEYIFHCDSDDYMEIEMLEELWHEAIEKNADIVWCDFYLTYKNHERYLTQPNYTNSKDALLGILSGTMKYNVWNKLVRKSIYDSNGIVFPAGYSMGEDMTMIKLFSKAKSTAYVPKSLYHYVKYNQSAFSNSYSDRHLLELLHNTKDIIEFLKANVSIDKEFLAYFLLEVKFPFLVSSNHDLHNKWSQWFPETDRYAFSNPNMAIHRKVLQLAAAKRQWWLVNLYNFFKNHIYSR